MASKAASGALHNSSVNLVGPDAFNTIALIVSAAGTQLPVHKNAVTCPHCKGFGYAGPQSHTSPEGKLVYGPSGGIFEQQQSSGSEEGFRICERGSRSPKP